MRSDPFRPRRTPATAQDSPGESHLTSPGSSPSCSDVPHASDRTERLRDTQDLCGKGTWSDKTLPRTDHGPARETCRPMICGSTADALAAGAGFEPPTCGYEQGEPCLIQSDPSPQSPFIVLATPSTSHPCPSVPLRPVASWSQMLTLPGRAQGINGLALLVVFQEAT